MRPLTETRPKPLVVLDGRALLDHVLDRLAAADIATAVVNVHYFADQIITHLADRPRPRVVISDERDALLDTGGGVVRALPLIGDGPFVIHNSDSVWIEDASNLDRLLAAFDADRMDSLMLMAPTTGSLGYDGPGDFAMDAARRLTRRRSGEVVPLAFTGVSVAHPRMFSDAPRSAFSLNKLWDASLEKGRLFGLELEGLWMHVGTPAALSAAEAAIAARKSS